jgi:hypothetical protein
VTDDTGLQAILTIFWVVMLRKTERIFKRNIGCLCSEIIKYLGKADGPDGQTITGSMNNTSGSDSFFYIELGAFVGDNGHYTISFTETDADVR